MDHDEQPRPDPMNDPRPIRLSKPLPPLDEPLIPQHEKDKLNRKRKKGGALRPVQKLNRAFFRTLLIGVPVTGITIVFILSAFNIVDNGLGRWICRARLGPHPIVFTVGLGVTSRLFLTNINGNPVCGFADRQGAVPSWSPDGKQIAFSSSVGDGEVQIFVINANDSGEHQITKEAGSADVPLWSPDGKQILYEAFSPNSMDPYAAIINVDGSNAHRLPAGQYVQDWSPDGKKILYYKVTLDGNTTHFQLWTMDANGRNVTRLLTSIGSDMFADWSSDGKHIVYATTYNTGILQIHILDANGQNQKTLTNTNLADREPRFSPDGKTILFSRVDQACGDIYAMDLEGKNLRRVTHIGCASQPDMAP